MIYAIVGPSADNIKNEKIDQRFQNTIWFILNGLRTQNNVEILSGGATGVDSLVKVLSIKVGYSFREILPIHNHWTCGEDCFGFKARNLELAKEADKVICVTYSDTENPCYHCKRNLDFKVTEHRRSGGCWTMGEAIKLGKEYELVIVSD